MNLCGIAELFFDGCCGRSLNELSEAGAGIGESPGRQFNIEIVERLPYNFDSFVVHSEVSLRWADCPNPRQTLIGFATIRRRKCTRRHLFGPPGDRIHGHARGQVPVMLESRHLNCEITDGGAFRRAKNDFKTCALSREVIEQGVLTSSPHDEQAVEFLPGDLGNPGQHFLVAGSHAVKDRVGERSGRGFVRDTLRLPETFELGVDFVDHTPWKHQLWIINVDQRGRRWQRSATREQLLKWPPNAFLFPFIHTLAEQPHTIYVFQKADSSTHTAKIREVQGSRIVGNTRSVKNSPDKGPCSGTNEGPVVANRRNRSDGGSSIVARGNDDFCIAKCRQTSQICGYGPKHRTAGHNFRRRRHIQAEFAEYLFAPRMSSQSDEPRMSRIRVFAHTLAREAVRNELRKIHPRQPRIEASEFVSVQLVQRIQSKDLNSGQGI